MLTLTLPNPTGWLFPAGLYSGQPFTKPLFFSVFRKKNWGKDDLFSIYISLLVFGFRLLNNECILFKTKLLNDSDL